MFFSENAGYWGKQLDDNIMLAEEGKYKYIDHIFNVFSEGHKKAQTKAGKGLASLLKHASMHQILDMEQKMRTTISVEKSIDWSSLDPEDFFTRKMTEDEKRAIVIFSSFHPSGYLREKAVSMLSEYSKTLPYILLRTNDWVSEVRFAADMALRARLLSLDDGELLASMPMLEKLSRSGRGYQEESLKTVSEELVRERNRSEMGMGLASKDQFTRKFCIDALINADFPDIKRIIGQVRIERNPGSRIKIFQKLMEFPEVDPSMILSLMFRDPYKAIRIRLLRYLYENNHKDTLNTAGVFLMDKDSSVRGLARWVIVKGYGEYNFRMYYLKQLQEGRNVEIALMGLGETGENEDIKLINSYLVTGNNAVRKAAEKAISQLEYEEFSAKDL